MTIVETADSTQVTLASFRLRRPSTNLGPDPDSSLSLVEDSEKGQLITPQDVSAQRKSPFFPSVAGNCASFA